MVNKYKPHIPIDKAFPFAKITGQRYYFYLTIIAKQKINKERTIVEISPDG